MLKQSRNTCNSSWHFVKCICWMCSNKLWEMCRFWKTCEYLLPPQQPIDRNITISVAHANTTYCNVTTSQHLPQSFSYNELFKNFCEIIVQNARHKEDKWKSLKNKWISTKNIHNGWYHLRYRRFESNWTVMMSVVLLQWTLWWCHLYALLRLWLLQAKIFSFCFTNLEGIWLLDRSIAISWLDEITAVYLQLDLISAYSRQFHCFSYSETNCWYFTANTALLAELFKNQTIFQGFCSIGNVSGFVCLHKVADFRKICHVCNSRHNFADLTNESSTECRLIELL